MAFRMERHIQADLEKKQYGLFNHSAVQICHWNKEALRGGKPCYKQKFYGVHTSRCMQFSPASMWCNQNCIFCWRPMEYMGRQLPEPIDAPEQIIPELISRRKQLLIGFKGNDEVQKEDFFAALDPDHFAISLSGEPTLYPALPEMVSYLKGQGARSIFVVTNGQEPAYFRRLEDTQYQPTQLYISIEGYDEASFREITKTGSWERLQQSLSIFRNLGCRRVFRITLMRGMNDTEQAAAGFARLIQEGAHDFIEVKSYMHLGMARERLTQQHMLTFREIQEFCTRLLGKITYAYEDDAPESVLVLLKKDATAHMTKIYS